MMCKVVVLQATAGVTILIVERALPGTRGGHDTDYLQRLGSGRDQWW